MAPCCFPCGQKPARIPKKSSRGPDQAEAEPAGGGPPEKKKMQKNEKARYPGEKPMWVSNVRYLIVGHRLFPSGSTLFLCFQTNKQ